MFFPHPSPRKRRRRTGVTDPGGTASAAFGSGLRLRDEAGRPSRRPGSCCRAVFLSLCSTDYTIRTDFRQEKNSFLHTASRFRREKPGGLARAIPARTSGRSARQGAGSEREHTEKENDGCAPCGKNEPNAPRGFAAGRATVVVTKTPSGGLTTAVASGNLSVGTGKNSR